MPSRSLSPILPARVIHSAVRKNIAKVCRFGTTAVFSSLDYKLEGNCICTMQDEFEKEFALDEEEEVDPEVEGDEDEEEEEKKPGEEEEM